MNQVRTQEQARPTRTFRPVSKSDFFPRLVGLQKQAHARHAAILKLASSGMPNKRRLTSVLDSYPVEERCAIDAVMDAYGPILMDHLDHSTLPLMFNGTGEAQSAEAPDFAAFVGRLKGRVLPFSGVAFPVRLGTMGNGYVLLTANYLDINAEALIDIHYRCYQLMRDLLSLDEKRSINNEVLSAREITCLQMAGDGMISEEIADKLGLSVHTVNAYLSAATTKLDSVNRIQAIAKAIRLGYIA